jgi:hypothetical protein
MQLRTIFRYPDIVLEPDKEDVQVAIEKAEKIYNFIRSAVGGL